MEINFWENFIIYLSFFISVNFAFRHLIITLSLSLSLSLQYETNLSMPCALLV